MNSPTSPASAPPPMVPSAKKRTQTVLQEMKLVNELHTVSAALETAYRDGWNAALAAQPPAPPVGKDSLRTESPPPQPGDAERLAQLKSRIHTYRKEWNSKYGPDPEWDTEFLLRLLDAAQSALAWEKGNVAEGLVQINKTLDENRRLQSALAESQENIRLLEKAHASNNQALSDARGELTASQAEVAWLHRLMMREVSNPGTEALAAEWEAGDLPAEAARSRSPAATGIKETEPLPMIPSARERLDDEPTGIVRRPDDGIEERLLLGSGVVRLQERAYRDGWNAALAARDAALTEKK